MPAMRVTGQGFGAGTRELEELPNCTQVVIGVRVDRLTGSDLAPAASELTGGVDTDADADADAGQPVSLLAANVDDATGEQLAHAVSVLLEAGAHDAWLAPVVMKKGRPGTVVHVLCDPSMVASLRGVIRETTGSLGVRMTTGERWPVARSVDSVWIDGQVIRLKVSAGRVKAEHDDVALAARRAGTSLREMAFRAEELWRSLQSGPRMALTGEDSSVDSATHAQPIRLSSSPSPSSSDVTGDGSDDSA
jgi:uncharacterized protein (DUF111 family)